MIERKITLRMSLSPEELAFEFCDMIDSDQAKFFNEVHRITEKWERPLCFQLQFITDNEILTDGGRRVMSEIGSYARKELVEEQKRKEEETEEEASE